MVFIYPYESEAVTMTVDEMIIWFMKLLAAEDAPDSEQCARMFERIFSGGEGE
ncbi:MAG: hypothetical protein IJR91_02300 [Ruminococcus sp.]|nr:hypothetical protein [Ruminococcus sp.]